jgi:hypothetical protein
VGIGECIPSTCAFFDQPKIFLIQLEAEPSNFRDIEDWCGRGRCTRHVAVADILYFFYFFFFFFVFFVFCFFLLLFLFLHQRACFFSCAPVLPGRPTRQPFL